MPSTRTDTLAEQLRANGYKLTKARQAVLHALASTDKPLAINDLHSAAQQFDPAIGLVTVYRTLEILESLDLVRPVHLLENCHGYTLATPGHTHHIVCHRCHTTIEIEGCDLSGFLVRLAAQTGFTITGHWLEIEGICPNCQRKE